MKFSLETYGSKKPPRQRTEATLQATLMADLETLLPRDAIAFSVPNGGQRNIIEAANFKRQGVKAGIPDILICHQGRVVGLELKAQGGALSDSQKNMFPKLRTAGMRIEVARSHGEALERIQEMGVPLRSVENRNYDVRDVFRSESKRGRA